MRPRPRGLITAAQGCALLVTALLTAGCGGGSVGSQAPGATMPPVPGSVPTAVAQAYTAHASIDPAIIAADNGFGLQLLNTLAASNQGNIAISPISVALALQIVYNGAAGTTRTAMANALQLGSLDVQAVNAANAALQAAMIGADPSAQFTVANSLWMHLSDNPVQPAFTATDQTYYGATIGDLAGAPANVNAWVARESDGNITQILPPGNYALSVAVIANTVYFKAPWSNPFDPALTTLAEFTLADGTQIATSTMHQNGSFAYFRGTDFQIIRLPYGSGRFSMLVVLPDATAAVGSFVAAITPDALNGWINQMQTLGGSIALPRFTTTFGAALNAALTSLGMGIAFSRRPGLIPQTSPASHR